MLIQGFFESIPILHAFEEAVRAATGPGGLGIIFVYSFLIAFILPLPSEVVLAAPLELGLSQNGTYAVIIAVSATGKAIGSLVALRVGMEAREYGPLIRFLQRSRFDIIGWSERQTVSLVQNYGFVGLAFGLSVPFFPDTLSIYAFSLLEQDHRKFALATWIGSANRLIVTLVGFAGFFAIV